MLELIVVRHAATKADENGITLGTVDWPLTEQGQESALNKSIELNSIFPTVDAIYASPLLRAQETTEIISSKYGLLVEIEPLLRERDFGELNGLTWNEFCEKYPALVTQNQPNYQPNLPNGESIPQVESRVMSLLRKLIVEHRKLIDSSERHRIMLVTHTGIIRILERILGQKNSTESRNNDPNNLDHRIYSIDSESSLLSVI